MPFLQRLTRQPVFDSLAQTDQNHLARHVVVQSDALFIDGEPIMWSSIEELEVAQAPDVAGPLGGLVRWFAHGGHASYHLAIYYGCREAVLNNISLDAAAFVVQMVAHYASRPVRYMGPEGLAPITEA
jgi:hypothetical protein